MTSDTAAQDCEMLRATADRCRGTLLMLTSLGLAAAVGAQQVGEKALCVRVMQLQRLGGRSAHGALKLCSLHQGFGTFSVLRIFAMRRQSMLKCHVYISCLANAIVALVGLQVSATEECSLTSSRGMRCCS